MRRMNMNKILKVEGLVKKYESFALKNVSFSLPQGYIMGFVGPNGAGKTTTIKAILNMIQIDGGEIEIFGQKRNRESVNNKIGVVMDTPFYVKDWTVNDVQKAVAPFYPTWDREKFARLMTRFGIDRTKKVKDLSRGMKVKLMLGTALSHDADLLILDEPTSGLDPIARDELCDLLLEFISDERKSVLFSTHITSDLEKIADYITFILDGQIIYSGAKEDLLESYVLVKGRELDVEQKRLLIGLRENQTGFSGITEINNMGRMPKDAIIEPISLDEFIIAMNRGRN
jgi:ABC-2 type transport system ATP-binding protein